VPPNLLTIGAGDSGNPCRNDAVGAGRLNHLFSHYHFLSGYGASEAVPPEAFSRAPNPTYALIIDH